MAGIVAYTGLNPQVLDFLEGAATQTFTDGDLVEINTSGKLTVATAGDMIGIARRDAQGVEDSVIPVELINFNEIYVILTDGTSNQNQLGLQVLITSFSAGALTIDETANAAGEVSIVGLHPDDGAMASGRLLVRFNADKIEPRTD